VCCYVTWARLFYVFTFAAGLSPEGCRRVCNGGGGGSVPEGLVR
jgi:hypothetical protein